MSKKEKKEVYTNILRERVYYCNSQENDENIHNQIDWFLKELMSRRRNDPHEGGLQAEMIVMPEAFAAKVNENNGYGPHIIAGINLYKCIKHETRFFTEHALGNYGLFSKEVNEILKNGLEIRILDGKNTIMVAICANNNIKSEYQIKVLEILIDKLNDLQRNRAYTHVKAGVNTPISYLEMDDVKRYAYDNLKIAIKNEKQKLYERSFDNSAR